MKQTTKTRTNGKRIIGKRITLWVMTVILAVSLTAGATTAFGASKTTVKLEVSAQMENEFLIPHEELSVSSDLSDKYGFDDEVTNGVSALDVLIAAHIELYGASFSENPSDYLEVNWGFATKLFGEATWNGTYTVNGRSPCDRSQILGDEYWGLGLTEAEVKSGDVVSFVILQAYYPDGDWFAGFYKDGKEKRKLAVEAGKQMPIQIKGYMSTDGFKVEVDSLIEGIKDAYIGTVKKWGINAGKINKLNDVVSVEGGNFDLQFDTAGIYYLSAFTDPAADGSEYMVSPWCKVEVLPEGTIASVEDLIAAIGKVDKNSGKKIKAAREAYNDLSVEARELVSNSTVLVKAEEAYKKAIAKPKAPSLKGKAGKNQAKLSWKKVAGADGYIIYMKKGKNGSFKKVKTLSKTATSCTIKKLKKGETYSFKAKAYKAVEKKKKESNFSKVVKLIIK